MIGDVKRLDCKLQNYKWGKVGSRSFISKLKTNANDENETYAELWMGTHPNGPSHISNQDLTLLEYLQSNQGILGEQEGDDLKFLFKVLSVGKALSIQVHPTKEQARELHSSDPINYPDENHKPEMAIALTPFEMLCGFRMPHEIVSNVKAHRELLELINENELSLLAMEHCQEECRKKALQAIFSTIWMSPDDKIRDLISEIISRVSKKVDKAPVDELILRLNGEFPGDIGVLAPLFLNFFSLKSGEAVFLGPNEPHAYLSGDCIECMACSDNTVRAGLTPKFKDVSTLCRIMTYNMSPPPIIRPIKLDDDVFEYSPLVSEFAVHKITDSTTQLTKLDSSSILIVVAGECIFSSKNEDFDLKVGDVLFLPKGSEGVFEKSTRLCCFRAFTPVPVRVIN